MKRKRNRGMQTPITEDLERELIEAGALDENGLIKNPKLRTAFDRICDSTVPMRVSSWQALCNAERFILGIHRTAKNNGMSFQAQAIKLGY